MTAVQNFGHAEQLAHYAAVKARLFNVKPRTANTNIKPKPVMEVKPIKARQIPMWEMGDIHFDAHVIDYLRWQVAMDEVRAFQTHGTVVMNLPEQKKTINEIIAEVLEDFPGVTVADIKGKRRHVVLVRPRHVAIYEVWRQRKDLSLPVIGRHFGGRDHTTILNSVKKIRAEREAAD